jgi:hypothetical protein
VRLKASLPLSARDDDLVDEEVLEEGCYFLSLLGLSTEQLAAHFELPPGRIGTLVKSYEAKIKSGKVVPGEFDQVFWDDVRKEAEGDVKLTFLSEKGFHHAWKSELQKLDGPALMSIYESSKDFLSADPNRKFLDYPPPKGYDPLAMDRELRKAVAVVEELLADRWAEEKSSGRPKPAKP